jgi:hypothetical protein
MKDRSATGDVLKRFLSIAAVSAIAVFTAFVASLFFSGEVRSMNTDNLRSYEAGSMPPMDAETPAHIETATFALG